MTDKSKKCSKCGFNKLFSQFYTYANGAPRSTCKACDKATANAQHKAKRDAREARFAYAPSRICNATATGPYVPPPPYRGQI